MNILLHICCAPCSLYTIDKLRQDGHKVQGFFYNPNIYPLSEYKLRRQAVVDMAKKIGMQITYKDENVGAYCNTPLQKPQRCNNCWRLRLCETAKQAKESAVDAFSTTLLISPYQNHEQIRIIGGELGIEQEVSFYYEDFRPGFRQSQAMAREACYYRQKYCGCEDSINERSQ